MDVRLAATKAGKITGAEMTLRYQAGAFQGSPVNLGMMTAFACYDVEALALTGYDVVSNRPKVAAYRAPGAPMAAFAVESAIDDLAMKLDMDPIDLRLLNAVRDGAKTVYGATVRYSALVETLEAIKASPHYQTPVGKGQARGVAAGRSSSSSAQIVRTMSRLVCSLLPPML
jgi:CO/xanthine dehydrogenase Mo-binding subunit